MTSKRIFILLISFKCMSMFCQIIPFRIGDKWGYSDTSGQLIIEPKYNQADFFENNVAFVQIDSFYFLINAKTEILSGGFLQHGTFRDGLCPVIDQSKKAYYIFNTGKIAFNFVFSAAENFSEGLAVVAMKNKLGIINKKGAWVREPSFDSSSIYFKSGFLLAKNKSRFFYIDKNGKTLLLPDSIKPAGIFSEGLAAVYVEHKIIENNTAVFKQNLQFIDTSGRIVLSEFINDSLNYADYIHYEKEFVDGKAIVRVFNQLAYDRYFIDKSGHFSPLYSFAQQLGDSMFLGVVGYFLPTVRIYDQHFYVMGNFNMVLNSVGVFGDGLLQVQNKAGFWGFCDHNANMVIPFIYESSTPFNNGYAIVVKQGKYGVIDKKGMEFFR